MSHHHPRHVVFVGVVLIAAAYAITCLVLTLVHPQSIPLSLLPRQRQYVSLPQGFLLGTATAAHQVEGGNLLNDWANWEQEPGRIARGEHSGAASDEWNRVPEDIRLMQALGANAYRFSIEWSRLEPQEGTWDEAAWQHYANEIAQLRAAGIMPMVTLLHFTLPRWIAARGGLRASDFPARFERFATEAAQRLGPQVHLWCTLNEPNVQMVLGYIDGRWPPGEREPQHAAEALMGLAHAHAAAADALHRYARGAQVGVAINLMIFDPKWRWSLPDWLIAATAARAYDWTFDDAIQTGRVRIWVPGMMHLDERVEGLKGSADFIGVNYYTRSVVHFSPGEAGMFTQVPGPGPRTDMDWEIYPQGMLRVLRDASRRYALPIYVTENGIADAEGTRRPAFLQRHLEVVAQAIAEGIPVRGYFCWSLLDNFEWAEGFRPRFGLYRVNYMTQERTPAPGSEVFRTWARDLVKQ